MKEFDIIVIGGGHQGLALGAMLAKCGKEVLLFERNVEFGGGLCTQEPITPSFLHNMHSIFHAVVGNPPFTALNLKEYVDYIEPEAHSAMPLLDGRVLVMYHDLDKTCESMARFSKKDAETFRRLHLMFQPFLENVFRPLYYSPPLPKAEREAIFSKTEAGRMFMRLTSMIPRDAARELFESEPLRANFCFLLDIVGGITDDVLDPLGDFVRTCFGSYKRAVCVGGSHNLGHALHKVFVMNGGQSAERCHVEKIIVRKGRAVGVLLREGDPYPEREVFARDAVVSAVDLQQTFLRLLEPEAVGSSIIEKVKNYKTCDWSLFGLHIEMKEPPHYAAAKSNPDVDHAFNMNIGYESTDLLAEHWRQIRAGVPPTEIALQATSLTVFDPTQAPAGRHTGMGWQFVPYRLKDGGPEAWDKIKWDYAERCIEKWRLYAPNLTYDNITGVYAYSPLDIERRHISMFEGDWSYGRQTPEQAWENRPLPELSHYRTPIKGLYLCGSCCHPRASISCGPAYNAAGVIAEDLGIKKWWTPPSIKLQW